MTNENDPSGGAIDINRVRRRKIERRIEDFDAKHLDPTERAELVLTLLFKIVPSDHDEHQFQGETWWDLFCFACSFITHASVGLQDEELTVLARALNQWLHSAHYSSSHLEESREERTEFWLDIVMSHIDLGPEEEED